MSDPLSLVPFALAARVGVIDGWPVRQLVAAGIALLRGSAPLVRSLAGKRSAILLPPGPLFYTALAASDGRGALLLDPGATPEDLHRAIAAGGCGAVFTTNALQERLPSDLPRLLLDDAPFRARYLAADRAVDIDLAMHVGMSLEGDSDVAGSNEEMLAGRWGTIDGLATLAHRQVLSRARAAITAARLVDSDHVLVLRLGGDAAALASSEVAILLAGGRATTADPRDASAAVERLERLDISLVAGDSAALDGVLAALATRGALEAPSLRSWLGTGPKPSAAAGARWADATAGRVPWIAAPDA